jgi:hypothetical protein
MISYELAKQLKDAGFPQTGRGGYLSMSNGLVGWSQANLNHGISQPTLEELIEACGDKFGNLARNGGFVKWTPLHSQWVAWRVNDRLGGYGGSTSIEAVARLWLALNTK